MSKTYRPYEPDQILLLPPSVKDWLPAGHLAHGGSRFILRFAQSVFDGHRDQVLEHAEVRRIHGARLNFQREQLAPAGEDRTHEPIASDAFVVPLGEFLLQLLHLTLHFLSLPEQAAEISETSSHGL